MCTQRIEEDGTNWEVALKYTLPCAKQIARGTWSVAQRLSLVLPPTDIQAVGWG